MEQYSLIYTDRKTMALIIKADGHLEVRAPYGTSRKMIDYFVRDSEAWIQKKRQEVNKRAMAAARQQKKFRQGEAFFVEGKKYYLDLVEAKERKKTRVSLVEDTLLVEVGEHGRIEEAIYTWYRELAKKRFFLRTAYFAEKIGVTYGQIRIKEQKTRWGSCSEVGNLNYNWKLIMAPPEILDYVVVHELCHRIEMNHSPRFWRRVQQVLPGYLKRKNWLKMHGNELTL